MPQISNEQIELLKKVVSAAEGFHFIADRAMIIEADKVLKALPLITGEPKAWLINFKDMDGMQRSRSYTHNAIGVYRQIDRNATSEELFTHPLAPLKMLTLSELDDKLTTEWNLVELCASVQRAFAAKNNLTLEELNSGT